MIDEQTLLQTPYPEEIRKRVSASFLALHALFGRRYLEETLDLYLQARYTSFYVSDYLKVLKSVMRSHGITVDYRDMLPHGWLGLSFGGRVEVALMRDGRYREQSELLSTLLHELVHELFAHASAGSRLPRALQELQAESATYLVLSYLGMGNKYKSWQYISGYGNTAEALLQERNRVQAVASYILVQMKGSRNPAWPRL